MRYVLTAIMVGTLGFFAGRADAVPSGNYVLRAQDIKVIEETTETLVRVQDSIQLVPGSAGMMCGAGLEILRLLPDITKVEHFQMYEDLNESVKTIKETCETTATARPATR